MKKTIFDPKYPITKMHGTGNDFIFYVDFDERTKSEDVRKICNRNFGIGADGVITITKSRVPQATYRMKYFNSDGSLAEMCGNGIRCFAKYLIDNKLVSTKKIAVDTDAGVLIPEVITNNIKEAVVRVNMGKPVLINPKHTTRKSGKDGVVRVNFSMNISEGKKKIKLEGIYVSMGNPHAIFFVRKGLAKEYAGEYGPLIEKDLRIFPQKTNVEFVEINNKKDITVYVWERGSGLTLSCGTGACATLVAAVLSGYANKSAKLRLPGGALEVSWEGGESPVYMTGPAVNVFRIENLSIL